jgi:thioredoxin 1
MISPFFDELSKEFTSLKFLKVDVDEFEELSGKAGVSAMPTFFVYKDGQIIEQMVGASQEKLRELVAKHAS